MPSDPADLERLPKDVWRRIQLHLLKMQPARAVKLVGKPPHAILVVGYGDEVDVAPALLGRVEQLIGTTLRIEPS